MNRIPTLAHLTELVLLFLFSIPALSPLFTTAPTRSADGLLHLYRLVELNTLWQQGVFFTRWLPDLAYGYGMPLFNYYAPLVYYLTTPLHLLGIPFTLALNLSLAAALFIGAVGMLYFARTLASRVLADTQKIAFAALITAIAYLYSPYLLFNALHRANLAEQWALAFAPFALWRFFVLTEKPTARNWVLAVLSFAAVMLSHNVTSFLFAPLLFFVTLVCLFSNSFRSLPRASVSSQAVLWRIVLRPKPFFGESSFVLSAFLIALTLSAFFWLPALLERDFVQIARVILTPDFDYRFNFVPLFELLSFLPRADTGRLNPSFPSTLGVIQIFGAVAGIVVLVWRFRTRHALPFYALVVATLAFIGLMLSFSQPIWDNISLLSFVQLPMRLRGLVALCLAPLISIFIVSLAPRWQFVRGLGLVVLVLFALPMLYPRYAADVPPNPTLSDMFTYEQSSGAFGTTSFGEYLPVWVQNPPDKSPFTETYAQNENPNRLVIPEGVNLCGNTLAPTIETICTTSNDSWHAVYQSFYIPGWQVTLNGQPIAISPTPRTGLISFEVPQRGTLRVEYAGTLIEHFADWFSIASAVTILGITAYAVRNRTRAPISPSRTLAKLHSPMFPRRAFAALVLIALTLVALKMFYVDRVDNPFLAHFDSTQITDTTRVAETSFQNQIVLLGSQIPSSDVHRGETFLTILYWRALPGMTTNLSTFVHLTAADGFVVAQKDSLHPGNLPTTQWESDGYISDEHTFQIPSDLTPGTYELRIGVYDLHTNTRLTAPDGADYVLLEKILVE